MDKSVNAPQKQGNVITEWVWFEGATALKEGQGVCYNYDYGTATDSDARRTNRVELPSITNARYFAGVAARDYVAKANGQMIEIYKPGSTCKILAKANLTLGSGIITCQAGGTLAGYFTRAGFEGEGSAVPLQTVDRSTTAGKCLAYLQGGLPSGLVEVVAITADGGAVTCMVGGVTYIGGVAIVTADATFTLADGTIAGLRKKFAVEVDLGDAKDFIVTVNGVQVDGSTALQTVIMDDIGDADVLEWNGDWYEKGRVGATVT